MRHLRKVKNLLVGSVSKWIFERWFKINFDSVGYCYIAQNCIGGRFYKLQKRGYSSPTVGLWFEPSDFIKFCINLKENLESELVDDPAEAARMGYPVGRLNGIKVMFQHYPTFDVAKADWDKRAARVVLDDVFFLMTDRDGFSPEELKGFEELPSNKKILFSHRHLSSCANAVYVPGYEMDGCVGDLYGEYEKLNAGSVRKRLMELLSN